MIEWVLALFCCHIWLTNVRLNQCRRRNRELEKEVLDETVRRDGLHVTVGTIREPADYILATHEVAPLCEQRTEENICDKCSEEHLLMGGHAV